ncbi:Portal protein, partial [uncultured Caudovirales phage]
MARKNSADHLKHAKMRLEASKKWRKQDGYDGLWKRMNDLYRGKHFDDYKNQDQMLVNIAFSTVNVISPSISVNYPKITVNATSSEFAAQAVVAEAVVNYWWKHKDIRTEFRRAVKDMLAFGHGWIKVGYRFVEEEVEGESEISEANPDGIGHPNTIVREDSPFAERVSINDVFVDPDATSMKDIKWIAQRIRRPIADVRNDKRYSKAARLDVSPMAVSRYADDPSRRKVYDKNEGYAEIWEYYDISTNSMSVFSEGSDMFLVKPMKMPYSFGQPFVMIRNYDVPDHFYPIGDLESIEPLQLELNETRSQMMNHRKKFSRKYLYKESAFDQLGRSALESDEDNVMVPVSSDEPIGNVVTAFPAVINPPEFYNQSNMIIGDIDRISGVSEFQRGAVSELRRTASEVNLLQDAANARTSDKLAVVEQAIAEVGRRMLQLAQQFMQGEQVARVMGRDGEPLWINFDRDYLQGD